MPKTVVMPNLPPVAVAPITSPPMRAVSALQISSATDDPVNREAQITTVLALGFAFAVLGWATASEYGAAAPVRNG
jgi:hypothetical protein